MENKSTALAAHERELINMIRNSPDPVKALMIATDVLMSFLKSEGFAPKK